MDALLSARATLIQRYVLSEKIAIRVSVCGEEDLLNGEVHSFVTVYVHKAQVGDFFHDFANFASETPGGSLGVNGIPVSVVVVDPLAVVPKPAPAKPNQPDNKTDFPTRKI
jgi:hypothetical protein